MPADPFAVLQNDYDKEVKNLDNLSNAEILLTVAVHMCFDNLCCKTSFWQAVFYNQ